MELATKKGLIYDDHATLMAGTGSYITIVFCHDQRTRHNKSYFAATSSHPDDSELLAVMNSGTKTDSFCNLVAANG